MNASVYRKVHFNAAHRLHNANWSAEKNAAVFGLCNNPNYHGHNYELIVKVTGPIDPETGYVIDLKILKQIIHSEITSQFDHKNLNLDVPAFKNLNPSAENVAVVIWQKLRTHLAKKYTLQVRLYETARNFVEYPSY